MLGMLNSFKHPENLILRDLAKKGFGWDDNNVSQKKNKKDGALS